MTDWRSPFKERFSPIIEPETGKTRALSSDQSALTQFYQLHGLPLPPPGLALKPKTIEDIQAIVRMALKHDISVMTRGGGSGVMQGIFPDPDSIIVDLSHFMEIGPLDAINGLIPVGAGVNGLVLEKALQENGWTLGHWPQSIAMASMGGLVATKSIGQYSTKYGGIEDMVRSLDVVTGTGELIHVGQTGPRRSLGPEILPLFMGSEGTLGIITRVLLRVWPIPPARYPLAITFPGFSQGIEVMRQWLQGGLKPSVVRLYDPAESARAFHTENQSSVLLALFEGLSPLAQASRHEAIRLSHAYGAEADNQWVDDWLKIRNDVGAWGPLLQAGYLVDTIEVAAGWTTLASLHQSVLARTAKIPGVLAMTAHVSHAYSDGANLYFTFLAKPTTPEMAPDLYHQIWAAVMEETLLLGGSVSHHHGIGRIRKEWALRERPDEAPWLEQIRAIFDPGRIMNRGALWNL